MGICVVRQIKRKIIQIMEPCLCKKPKGKSTVDHFFFKFSKFFLMHGKFTGRIEKKNCDCFYWKNRKTSGEIYNVSKLLTFWLKKFKSWSYISPSKISLDSFAIINVKVLKVWESNWLIFLIFQGGQQMVLSKSQYIPVYLPVYFLEIAVC